MTSTWGHAQTPSELLSQADRLADKGNGFRAAPLYAKAEREFQGVGDRRNELYAKFGRLRGEAETGSYKAVRSQVMRDLADSVVDRDAGVYRPAGSYKIRHVHFRLRCAYWFAPGDAASRANDGHRIAKWQRI